MDPLDPGAGVPLGELAGGIALGLQIYAFVWGAVWGSFINVVIHRVPLGASLVHPPSACAACGARIRWFDNIPIVSYLALRGRCRACGSGYSPRYMLVELLCGVLSLALFRALAVPIGGLDPLIDAAWQWLWLQTFVYGLVAITFIDLEHLYIPDEISIGGLMLGLAGAHFLPVEAPQDHTLGALAGAGFLGLVWAVGWVVYRREAMGLGDVKLLAMIGAFLGWRALPFVLFAAAVQALIATLLARLYTAATGKAAGLTLSTAELDAHFDEEGRYDEGLPEHTAIPFGPFLALAGIEALFFGGDLLWAAAEAINRALLGQ